MPDAHAAKVPRKRRSSAQMAADAAGGADPFDWLVKHWCALDHRDGKDLAEKVRLSLELAPYLHPKLKAVDITQRQDVKVTITIGGKDADS